MQPALAQLMYKMRLHCISLPHTEVTKDYGTCAYTQKVRKFCNMMSDYGHDIYLYSSGHNDAKCKEHIQILDKDEFEQEFGGYDWHKGKYWAAVDWNPELHYWKNFNNRVIKKLEDRLEPKDLILFITGWSQSSIIEAFPNHQKVEFGIGYEGIHPSTFHIFESYTWMHCLYGKEGPSKMDGKFYDAVIPNYFDVAEFEAHKPNNDPYFLFLSRMIPRKGYEIAIEATKRIGARLIIAGTGGDRPEFDHVEYFGYADSNQRRDLLSGATGLFCPTLYLEPFGGVTIEAALSGCPSITTDFGVFPETIGRRNYGYLCHTMKEFADAATQCYSWDQQSRDSMRTDAINNFSTQKIAQDYQNYFDRLNTLWGDGFYC